MTTDKTNDMHKFSFLIFAILTLTIGCDQTKKVGELPSSTEHGSQRPETAPVPVSDAEANARNPATSGSAASDSIIGSIPESTGDVPFSLKFLSWNVESEGSDPATITKELASLGNYDLIALTEVLPGAAKEFCTACGDSYNYILTDSGRNDRMMLIYNRNSLNFVRKFELDDINYKYRYRSPLVGQFKEPLSGKELLVMVNHLARGKEKIRQVQAKDLVKWGREQTMPVIALGDYNFDYVFDTRKGNEAFRLFMKDNVWQWIEPIELIDTNWYDNPEQPDGKDDYPGSMLDFGFVAGPAKKWRTSCKVIVRDGDFPDNEKTSDHRPFEVIVSSK